MSVSLAWLSSKDASWLKLQGNCISLSAHLKLALLISRFCLKVLECWLQRLWGLCCIFQRILAGSQAWFQRLPKLYLLSTSEHLGCKHTTLMLPFADFIRNMTVPHSQNLSCFVQKGMSLHALSGLIARHGNAFVSNLPCISNFRHRYNYLAGLTVKAEVSILKGNVFLLMKYLELLLLLLKSLLRLQSKSLSPNYGVLQLTLTAMGVTQTSRSCRFRNYRALSLQMTIVKKEKLTCWRSIWRLDTCNANSAFSFDLVNRSLFNASLQDGIICHQTEKSVRLLYEMQGVASKLGLSLVSFIADASSQ